MISHFFIDRPIFAAVISIVIVLTGGIAAFNLPIAQYPQITPPAVQVSISYPGANAKVVADTVAAPIEQQVNGVEGMLYMSSQMGNDGSYSLTVTFDIGTDLNTALVMVQNRVSLAMPQLPNSVQNQGITIRKKTPDILMVVNFFSPNDRYDNIYLSNYATINIKDELLRIQGVSDAVYLGQRDYSIRAWLDPQKLSACNMTAMDVAAAIQNQNLDAPIGQVGQPPSPQGQSFQLPVNTLGRLVEPEQFGDIIVKVGSSNSSPSPRSVPVPQPGGTSSSGDGIDQSFQPARDTTNLAGDATDLAPSTTTTTTTTTIRNLPRRPTLPAGSNGSGNPASPSATVSTAGVSGGGSTGGGGPVSAEERRPAEPARRVEGRLAEPRMAEARRIPAFPSILLPAVCRALRSSAARAWRLDPHRPRSESSACATWHASRWGLKTTISSAHSTAIRPSDWPFSNCRTRMRWMSPTWRRKKWPS